MSDDLEICASIAANLEESGWSSIFSQLDKDTFNKIQNALYKLKDIADTPEEKITSSDPTAAIKQLNAKINKLVKGLKAHRDRFRKMEQDNKSILARIGQIESQGTISTIQRPIGGTTQRTSHKRSSSSDKSDNKTYKAYDKEINKRASRKLKSMPREILNELKEIEEENDEKTNRKSRMHFYQFGSRKLQVLKPNEYPIKKHAQRPVEGKLELFYSHGYSGNFDESRQNIYLSHDGKYLIYYIAAIIVVFDYNLREQKFFTKHNDDITTICLSPNKPWVASGQKDPKDEPGQGADLPKIWVWNYKSMKAIQLIDNVCWGKISRLQWSKSSNLLYCICGDIQQSLKAYDPEHFTGKTKSQPKSLINVNTTKELILGFVINNKPNKVYLDEFIIFGKRKFCHCGVVINKSKDKNSNKLLIKIKSVSIASYRKDGEKSFGCACWLKDGKYLVGSRSGTIYIGREKECIGIIKQAHNKIIGCLILINNNYVLSAGYDKIIKKWKLINGKKNKSNNNNDDEKEEKKIIKKKTKSIKKTKKTTKTTTKTTHNNEKESIEIMRKEWEYEVNLADTDYILYPKSMCYNNKTNELFIGSKTNQIMRFSMEEKEDASVIVDGHDGAIWGLCTHPFLDLFATGGYDNAIKIWDAKTMTCIKTYEFELEQGDKQGHQISCGHWNNDGDVLVFGTENTSCIAVFWFNSKNMDLQFQQIIEIPPKNKNAEVEPVAYLRFSNDGNILGAAHMDSNLYIYSVQSAQGRVILQQWPVGLPHVAAPVNIQFSDDGKLVKTLTRDYEVVHWELDIDRYKGKFIAKIPDPDVIKWADDPLIAGWDVEGLYQKGWDGTDLNDATLTSDEKLVATGDDYGKVRLHNFPSTDQKTCNVYEGHAEFVVGVEFLRDDSQLITCGGADQAIFQWKLYKNYKD